MDTFNFIDQHNEFRELLCELACANSGELMGEDAWLRHVMGPRDMMLRVYTNGINCSGSVYTMQTMDHEWFDFTIPFERIRELG